MAKEIHALLMRFQIATPILNGHSHPTWKFWTQPINPITLSSLLKKRIGTTVLWITTCTVSLTTEIAMTHASRDVWTVAGSQCRLKTAKLSYFTVQDDYREQLSYPNSRLIKMWIDWWVHRISIIIAHTIRYIYHIAVQVWNTHTRTKQITIPRTLHFAQDARSLATKFSQTASYCTYRLIAWEYRNHLLTLQQHYVPWLMWRKRSH